MMNETPTKKEIQPMNIEGLDPLFAPAALYAASRAELSDAMLAKHFDLDEARARTIMDELAAHGLLASTRHRYCGRTVLVEDVEDMRSRLADIGVTVDEDDESPVDPGKHMIDDTAPQADEQAQPITTNEAVDPGADEPGMPEQTSKKTKDTTRAKASAEKKIKMKNTNQKKKTSSRGDGGSKAEPARVWLDCQPDQQTLPLAQVKVDPAVQCRAEMNEAIISEYAEQMTAGAVFPAVTVFHHKKTWWLADGFHRHAAATQAGLTEINAQVYEGDRRDALLYAAGANACHGLRRTNADKRRAIRLVFSVDESVDWSNNAIAKIVGVSDKTVAEVRRELEGTSEIPKCSQRRTRDGRVMDTTGHTRQSTGRDASLTLAAEGVHTAEDGTATEHVAGAHASRPTSSRPWWDGLVDLLDQAEQDGFELFAGDEQAKDQLMDLLTRQTNRLRGLAEQLVELKTTGRAAA